MRIPWRKANQGQADIGKAESVPADRATEDAEDTIPTARESAEWIEGYSDRIAADAQRIIDELHRKIAESADRAIAELGGSTSSPSSEETSSPSEGPQSPENRQQ